MNEAARAPRALEDRSPSVCGVVICGGASRRMGADKAELELGGRTLLARAIASLEPLCGRVVLACGARPRYAALGRELVLDAAVAPEGAGPVAGILGALEAVEAEHFVVLACDMPRVGAELLGALLACARREALDACLFESSRGLEPLCAVYRRDVAPAIRQALAQGERRVVAFLNHLRADGSRVRAGTLKECELGPALAWPDPAHNINTPADLAREGERWAEERVL